jgi:quercetin dioxygenase-like cupin family protein
MKTSEEFIDGQVAEIVNLGGGISRQILGYNHELMVVKVWFDAGAVGYLHQHRHSQVTYIESGEFDVNVGGVIKRMRAGDSFFMAPNIEHGSVCIKSGVMLDSFSPKRDDFLPAIDA